MSRSTTTTRDPALDQFVSLRARTEGAGVSARSRTSDLRRPRRDLPHTPPTDCAPHNANCALSKAASGRAVRLNGTLQLKQVDARSCSGSSHPLEQEVIRRRLRRSVRKGRRLIHISHPYRSGLGRLMCLLLLSPHFLWIFSGHPSLVERDKIWRTIRVRMTSVALVRVSPFALCRSSKEAPPCVLSTTRAQVPSRLQSYILPPRWTRENDGRWAEEGGFGTKEDVPTRDASGRLACNTHC